MNKILVTGATGFIGGHFCDFALENNLGKVYAIKRYRSPTDKLEHLVSNDRFEFHDCDLLDFSSVYRLLREVKPDYIFHFAAQSSVGSSWNYPISTMMENSTMQANILEALRLLCFTPHVWIAGTSEEYGVIENETTPITETSQLRALNPYGVSKIMQEMMALQYGVSNGFPVVIARSFNIEGPRRSDAFVISSFAKQIACIEKYNLSPVIKVGDLTAKRDFVDVRDAVRGYWLMASEGEPLASYNVASGESHSIQEVLDLLIGFSKVRVTTEQDPSRMRPAEVRERVGSNTSLRNLGWNPGYTFEQTLHDVIDHWRVYA